MSFERLCIVAPTTVVVGIEIEASHVQKQGVTLTAPLLLCFALYVPSRACLPWTDLYNLQEEETLGDIFCVLVPSWPTSFSVLLLYTKYYLNFVVIHRDDDKVPAGVQEERGA